MNLLNNVCLAEDEYSKELYYKGARWIAHLSDSTNVLQDDGRPGHEWSAWKRLRNHVYTNNLTINSIILQFRSNKIKVLEPKEGVFYINAVAACLNSPETFNYIIFGNIKDDVVHTQKWLVPLMINTEKGIRPLDKCLGCVIFNDSRRKTISGC